MWYALGNRQTANGPRPSLVLGERCFDLEAAAGAAGVASDDTLSAALASVDSAIRNWDQVGARLDKIAEAAAAAARRGDLEGDAVASARFLTPFAPYRIFAASANYIEHAAEMETKLASKADSTPYVFMRSQSSVIGPDEAVVLPPESQQVDWEVELGVVIGRAGRRITVDAALDHIAGYVVMNDVSARDLTRRTDFPFSHDWFRGKSFDTFCPMGPWFVPRGCIADLHDLRMTLSVNAEMKQDGNSGDMIFNTFEQIAYLSTMTRLVPGDLLSTGTPAGVGAGTGTFLKAGDVMVSGIVGIGEIRNPIVSETV